MVDVLFEKVRPIVELLKTNRIVETQQLDGMQYLACDYKKENNTPPASDAGWKPFPADTRVSGKDGHYWFHLSFTTPQAQANRQVQFHLDTSRDGDWDGTNPQCAIYIDGKIVQGLDINHQDALLKFDTQYDMYLYFYIGMTDIMIDVIPSLQIIDTRIEGLYYDISVPYDTLKLFDQNDDEYVTILRELHQAVQLLDLRDVHSDAFYDSVVAARSYLDEHFYHGVCGKSESVVNCIGHTHIDVAWLWTLAQTEEKAQRSFATVINLMKQYPEYKFMSSQPQLYQYVKKYAPELYENIKQAVKDGRWEAEGAMWLEADCNLTSGESLVRQILFGKRFMREEFGVDNKILWLPDVFGYSAALPQILQKSGVDKFVTSKISWNEFNRMPYDTFLWEGIDGTEIFTYFMTAQDVEKKGEEPRINTTYVGYIRPSQVLGAWNRYQPKGYNNETVITYGFGDGGGGPTKDMIEQQRRLSYGLPGMPRTQMDTATAFLDRLEQNFKKGCEIYKKVPKWVGELYLELHRGTYTTMGQNKRYNRKSELLYQTTEAFNAAAMVLLRAAYPQAALNDGWETILLNQFHDIIPGSSIQEVYEDSAKQYTQVLESGKAMLSDSLNAMAGQIKTDGGLLVYNPQPSAFTGAVKAGETYVNVADVPAYGWKVVKPSAPQKTVKVSETAMENQYYAIQFDGKGNMISLFDKEHNREICKAGEVMNQLRVYEDYPYGWDAWDISSYYSQKVWAVDNLTGIKMLDEGARAGLELTWSYQKSTFTQRIYLYETGRRIDFETEVDWQEDHVLLKSVFPLDLHAAEASYEIQFGSVKRPLHENTSWDEAKFEVCAQKWADVSEDDYGVSIMTDCKYGYSHDGTTMMLSLLKAPAYPNPVADRGHHMFTYSLFAHEGALSSETVLESYRLNKPAMALEIGRQDGALADCYSFVSANQPDIIIDTVKKAEDSDDLVVRMYNCRNRRCDADIAFGFDVKAAHICDMMENNETAVEVNNNALPLAFKPFEIVTVKVAAK